jgi:hypothetical protein
MGDRVLTVLFPPVRIALLAENVRRADAAAIAASALRPDSVSVSYALLAVALCFRGMLALCLL